MLIDVAAGLEVDRSGLASRRPRQQVKRKASASGQLAQRLEEGLGQWLAACGRRSTVWKEGINAEAVGGISGGRSRESRSAHWRCCGVALRTTTQRGVARG
jgi:hypothetical protein